MPIDQPATSSDPPRTAALNFLNNTTTDRRECQLAAFSNTAPQVLKPTQTNCQLQNWCDTNSSWVETVMFRHDGWRALCTSVSILCACECGWEKQNWDQDGKKQLYFWHQSATFLLLDHSTKKCKNFILRQKEMLSSCNFNKDKEKKQQKKTEQTKIPK